MFEDRASVLQYFAHPMELLLSRQAQDPSVQAALRGDGRLHFHQTFAEYGKIRFSYDEGWEDSSNDLTTFSRFAKRHLRSFRTMYAFYMTDDQIDNYPALAFTRLPTRKEEIDLTKRYFTDSALELAEKIYTQRQEVNNA